MSVYSQTFFLLTFFVLDLPGVRGFQWEKKSDLEIKKIDLIACSGLRQTLMEPWTFILHQNETVQSFTWLLQKNTSDTEKAKSIAFKEFEGPFNTSDERLTFVPPTGLDIYDVTTTDAGIYSLVLTVNSNSQQYLISRSVKVRILGPQQPDQPQLLLQMDRMGVMDEVTREWSVYLRCGPFSSEGNWQPLLVTPKGESHKLTVFQNESYIYQIPDNADSGTYRCILPSDVQCTELFSNSLQVVMMAVRNSILRSKLRDVLSLAERQQQQLLHQRRELLNQMDRLRRQTEQFAFYQEEMRLQQMLLMSEQAQKQRLQIFIDRLKVANQKRVSFSAQSKYLSPQPTYPKAIIARKVELNQGGHYNSSTGHFTAPYSGTYLFTVAVTVRGSNNIFSFWLVVGKGSDKDVNMDSTREGLVPYLILHTLIPLEEGQSVWIMSNDYERSYTAVYFSGFLVSPVV